MTAERNFRQERLVSILRELDEKQSVRISNLARSLHVSEVTVRQDLTLLEGEGLVRRVHGGAVKAGDSIYRKDTRETVYRDAAAKIAIAGRAYRELRAHDTVLIDDSSTCLYLVQLIKEKEGLPLTVVTNSVIAAGELMNLGHVRLFMIGGEVFGNLAATAGETGEREVLEYHADVLFMGANGVDVEAGVTVIGYPQMMIKKAMRRCADRTVLLADGGKFGEKYLSQVCALSMVDLVITDGGADRAYCSRMRELVPVIIS
ncbi:DeoR/GlpR family DNA-binding transcription regulator [Diplocloster hominis]|uniref:DeoR/GlpR family DNA-binding transcription regulator n=1 Tax=Diplocloster hominis TaxID=3079010 RepID=UPI0031BB7F79